jgi:hypothetical protein
MTDFAFLKKLVRKEPTGLFIRSVRQGCLRSSLPQWKPANKRVMKAFSFTLSLFLRLFPSRPLLHLYLSFFLIFVFPPFIRPSAAIFYT